MKRSLLASLFAPLLAVALALVAPPAAAADPAGDLTDLSALRQAVETDKRKLVADTLKLGPAEARKFWPIYDRYQRDYKAADERRNRAIVALVSRDGPMTDAFAKQIVTELEGADETEMRARHSMQRRLLRAVSPRTAARYLQLESKIRAVEAYDIASSLPLVR